MALECAGSGLRANQVQQQVPRAQEGLKWCLAFTGIIESPLTEEPPMKLSPLVVSTVIAALASSAAVAQQGAGATCADKREAIAADIEAAKAEGQPRRVRGLERALAEVRRNCTDEKLAAEHRQRVRSHEQKVAQRERDLREAQRKGDADKIARREDKLREARAELERVRAQR
jgi:hypothetical protein